MPLTGDTTRVSWVARVHHASGDNTGSMTLRVRTTDHTAESDTLAIAPPAFRVLGLSWSERRKGDVFLLVANALDEPAREHVALDQGVTVAKKSVEHLLDRDPCR